MPMVAWYMLSKESYINRVIKEVLPTVAIRSELADEADGNQLSNYTALFAKKNKSAIMKSAGFAWEKA